MQLKRYIPLIATVMLLQAVFGCESQPAKATSPAAAVTSPDSAQTTAKPTALTDEQLFRAFISRFKNAVKAKDKAQLKAFFNFPLQTSPQWSNEDLKNSRVDYSSGLITDKEFATYYQDIFTNDAIKLIPAIAEDDLSEIDKTTTEDYYKKLMPVTDKGSTLYELEKQYTQDNGQETSFGFVFGKVKGSYKAISYYRPWPLKD